MMDIGLPFKESDLMSFGGLVLVCPILASAIQYFFKISQARVHLVILVLCYAIGMAAKIWMKGAFPNASYLGMAVMLFPTAVAACQAFDSGRANVLQFMKAPTAGSQMGIQQLGEPPKQG